MPFTGAEFWQDFSLGNVPQEQFCTTHLHQTSPKGLDVRSGDLTTNKFVEIFLQKPFWLFNRNPLICPFSEVGFKSVYSSHSYRMVENKLTSANWCLFVCVESESVDSIFISRYISRSNKDSFIIFPIDLFLVNFHFLRTWSIAKILQFIVMASSMNTTCNTCGNEVSASYLGRDFQRYHSLTAKTFPCNLCDNFFLRIPDWISAWWQSTMTAPISSPWKFMYRLRKDFCQCWMFARTQSKHASIIGQINSYLQRLQEEFPKLQGF